MLESMNERIVEINTLLEPEHPYAVSGPDMNNYYMVVQYKSDTHELHRIVHTDTEKNIDDFLDGMIDGARGTYD
jgi:hypothetical protein